MPRKSIKRSTSPETNIIDMKTGETAVAQTIPVICERIRHFREAAGMEQKELAAKIGISGNTVSNWENGRSRPDINLIPGICEVLNVSFADIFGVNDPRTVSPKYTSAEKKLLDRYRRLRPGNRYAVDSLIDTMLSVQQAEAGPMLCRIMFYQKSLAAGRGDPSEIEGKALPMFLYRDQFRNSAGVSISRRADCVFAVNGDSMEPDYHSGDLVLVERIPDAPSLNQGEIGAFIVGNETYIKEYSSEGLISLNPKYRMMRFDGENRVFLIGRVLGKLDPECIAAAQDIENYKKAHGENERHFSSDLKMDMELNDGEVICREFIDRYLR